MGEGFLNGLEHLPNVKALEGLQRAWHALYRVALDRYNRTAQLESWFDGYIDGFQVDLARSVGPPRRLFFLQDSEPLHAERCVEHGIDARTCWDQFKALWFLDSMEQGGLGFAYNWPPDSCYKPPVLHGQATTANWSDFNTNCIAKAHVMSFNKRHIVGDPTHWQHVGTTVPGYSWAAARRKECDRSDGWD